MSKRNLRLVDAADALQRDGDDYWVCEFLFHSFLAKTENRYNDFVTSKVVSDSQASALALAILKIEDSFEWQMVLGLHGIGQEDVEAFCVWLREGGFEIRFE
jgi:hypothetical protein